MMRMGDAGRGIVRPMGPGMEQHVDTRDPLWLFLSVLGRIESIAG